MKDLIANNPRGLRLSWAVRVRGLPHLFTDGLATWSAIDGCSPLVDTLAEDDFSFTGNANALDPTDVGTGMKIALVDTNSGVLRRLFAPLYYGPDAGTRVAGDFTVDDTGNLALVDGSLVAVDDELYIGNETMRVTVKPTTNTATVTRGIYGSMRQSHRVQFNEDGAIGPRVTKSPRIFRGRYVEVLVAGIGPDGSAADVYTWWAGRLGGVSQAGNTVTLDVDPLNAVIEEDEWPYVTAGGKVPVGATEIELPAGSGFVNLKVAPPSTGWERVSLTLGYYDSSDVFTVLPTNAIYTIAQLMTALAHTIQKAMLDTGSAFALGARNKFALAPTTEDFYIRFSQSFIFEFRNDTDMRVLLERDTGLGALLASYPNAVGTSAMLTNVFPARGTGFFFATPKQTSAILPGQTAIRVGLDSRWRPFTLTGYSDRSGTAIGYAKITDGSSLEIVSYTGATLSVDGRTVTLTGMTRGVANTTALAWPRGDTESTTDTSADAGDKPVRVEQLFFSSYDDHTFIWRLLVSLLKSSSTYPNQFNGAYDFFGEFGGLAIPEDFVWHEDIIAKLRRQFLPEAFMFFVTEPGKGKDEIKQWLKLFGIYLVTKRFERDGEWRYGLTVDIVDPDRITQYNEQLTDADRLGGSQPKITIDERIIINQISYRPVYKFGEDASSENVGGMRYVYAEESITDYGAAKAMELKASAMFMGSQGYGGTYTQTSEDLQTGIATEVALRMFGVYSKAVTFIDIECPHIGWRLQPADQVLLSLAGVPTPTGAVTMTSTVGKVVRAAYRTGENAGASLRLMITNTNAVEWAPSAQIISISGTALTLADNVFTDADATSPAIYGDPLPDYDGRFFRPTAYTAATALPVVLYDCRDYAGTAISTTVTVYTDAANITVAASAAALSAAATAGYVFMTLGAVSALPASARYAAHTFIASSKEYT